MAFPLKMALNFLIKKEAGNDQLNECQFLVNISKIELVQTWYFIELILCLVLICYFALCSV